MSAFDSGAFDSGAFFAAAAPSADPERFIEVLGAEILYFEVVGENKGPSYSDGDMTAAGLASAGTSVVSLGAARVIPGAVSSSGVGATAFSARAIAQAAAAAAGSSTIAAQTQATKYAAVYTAGSSTVFAPTQVLANGVVGFEGSSQADIGAVEVFLASLTSGGLATYSPSGLALARTIEVTDMDRPSEFRSMDRGLGDSGMDVPPDEAMDRPDEHRSMEVTS